MRRTRITTRNKNTENVIFFKSLFRDKKIILNSRILVLVVSERTFSESRILILRYARFLKPLASKMLYFQA